MCTYLSAFFINFYIFHSPFQLFTLSTLPRYHFFFRFSPWQWLQLVVKRMAYNYYQLTAAAAAGVAFGPSALVNGLAMLQWRFHSWNAIKWENEIKTGESRSIFSWFNLCISNARSDIHDDHDDACSDIEIEFKIIRTHVMWWKGSENLGNLKTGQTTQTFWSQIEMMAGACATRLTGVVPFDWNRAQDVIHVKRITTHAHSFGKMHLCPHQSLCIHFGCWIPNSDGGPDAFSAQNKNELSKWKKKKKTQTIDTTCIAYENGSHRWQPVIQAVNVARAIPTFSVSSMRFSIEACFFYFYSLFPFYAVWN